MRAERVEANAEYLLEADADGGAAHGDVGRDGLIAQLASLIGSVIAAGFTRSADGLANAAKFNHPCCIAVSDANIFVAEYLSSTIRRFTTGLVSPMLRRRALAFAFPTGIAVDGARNVS